MADRGTTLKITIAGQNKAGPDLADAAQDAGKLETKIEGLDKAFGRASAGAKFLGGALAGAGIGIALKALEGVGAIFDTMVGSIGDAQESALVIAQLESVLKSMGGASGMTAESVTDLADRISELTGIDDEAIVSAQSLLLTFGNIGKDIFPDTTQAVLDMATAMGTDFNSAAVTVGKALNDPIKGIAALTRMGVQFTEQQKDQITAMVEAGDVAGAQKLILAELQKQFGGSAEAAATNGKKLATAWGNVREEIGGRLLPIVERFTGVLLNMVRSDTFKRGLDAVMNGVVGLAGFIERAIPPVLKFVGGVVSAGKAVYEAASAFLTGKTNLGQFIGGMEIFFKSIGEKIGPSLGAVGAKVLDFMKGLIPQIGGQLQVWGQLFGDWVSETAWPWLSKKLTDLSTALGIWIKDTAAPFVAEKATALGLALGDWVTETAVPWLLKKIPEWVSAYTTWAETTARPAVIAKMKELATAMGDWIVDDAIPFLQANLPKWRAAILDWLKNTALPAIKEEAKNLARAFGDWIIDDAIPYLKTQLPFWIDALKAWLIDVAAPAVLAGAKQLGWAMVNGIMDGLREKWEDIKGLLGELAKNLPEPVRNALGISSPSTVFAAQVGVPIVQGIAAGIASQEPALKALVSGLAQPDVIRPPSYNRGSDPSMWRSFGEGAAQDLGSTIAGPSAAVAGRGRDQAAAAGGMTVNFNFPNLHDLGNQEQVRAAFAEMETTWSSIVRGGRVKR